MFLLFLLLKNQAFSIWNYTDFLLFFPIHRQITICGNYIFIFITSINLINSKNHMKSKSIFAFNLHKNNKLSFDIDIAGCSSSSFITIQIELVNKFVCKYLSKFLN